MVVLKTVQKYCSVCRGRLKRKPKSSWLICQKCGFTNYRNPRPSTAIIVEKGDSILLVKRAKAPLKGWWDLPGGFIEPGENAEESALREFEEETGARIRTQKLLGIYPGIYPDKKEPFAVLSITYLAKLKGEKLKPQDDITDFKFFEKSKLPKKIAFGAVRAALQDYLKN